ncbi:ubiquitin-protein ligase Sel1/Ubx2 [Xylona heveae TC161]|uniref:Ubiquitin-protein ligase Sel1/Ubx2 n=1 Tax=Xylona heveae (strain CBS 132557 / TC161) TaxID=1328760 RepID=A0A165GDP1_XYLHT|nr:ubiquitin-protein ligase Sel1/Ubx2 [Xylona heveae TC161]KZF22066.1 ubiquitin-protein ligase Sel1/Ubx2 [Xylona heveae TC161]
MRGRQLRLLPLLFVITCAFVHIACGQQEVLNGQLQRHEAQQAPELQLEHPKPVSHIGIPNDERRASDSREANGAPLVEEALALLRSLEVHRDGFPMTKKGSSLFGGIFYYAKEAFVLLFMKDAPQEEESKTSNVRATVDPKLLTAVELLKAASDQGHAEAGNILGDLNFWGNFSYPQNYSEALNRYSAASLKGNTAAQHMLGFLYGTGFGGAVVQDQAKSLLYHTFAALSGETRSEMTVAFRHYTGIATPRNCDEAVFYYKRVADKAVQYFRSGPPGGRALVKDSYRLSDDDGGVYGEGASVVSSGINANRGSPSTESQASMDDVLEYLDLMSRKGDLKATFGLGKLYYDGSRVLRQNYRRAKTYFMIVAKRYWGKDGKIIAGGGPGIEKLASKAAGYLGRMFLRGEGVEQNFDKALIWFRRGLANGDSLCQYSMGLMFLNGLSLPKDPLRAADYFKAAADQDFAPAQVRFGALLLDQGDVQVATKYFELAARHGNIEAFYFLAEISNQGIGRDQSCGVATTYYKIVAEKAEAIHSSFPEANHAYESGDRDFALATYMMAAEQGYETAQANVAYILDHKESWLSTNVFSRLRNARQYDSRLQALALIYWTRSAKQSNVDSMVKMGDYYLAGLGSDPDSEKAAACYQTAAEFQQSAQALWNLGWMHENGVGVEQDFHLAKRFYDQALETNSEAYLPVTLSLLKLRMRSFWNTVTHGRVKSIQSEPVVKKEWSVREWIHNFLAEDQSYYNELDDDDLSDPNGQEGMPGGDEYYDDLDGGMMESLIIIGLAATLAFLMFYRQQRQLNHQRAAEQQRNAGGNAAGEAGRPAVPGQQPDGGFFPPPGDPDFNRWVAGAVAH